MAPFTRQQEAVAKEVAAVARALKRQRASKRKKTEFTYASYKRMYQEVCVMSFLILKIC